MLCWISKGLINISRDYHTGIIKDKDSGYYIIRVVNGDRTPMDFKYELTEVHDFESDFQIMKDCFLNTYRGTTVRMFNPPTGVDLNDNSTREDRAPSRRRDGYSTITLPVDMQGSGQVVVDQNALFGISYNVTTSNGVFTPSSVVPSDDHT